MVHEAGVLVPLFNQCHDWEQVRQQVLRENLLQARTRSSAVRMLRETIKRLEALTDEELEIVPSLTAMELGHLMWAAACRRYAFIGEFAEEVLRERFLTLSLTLTVEEYDSFFRSKVVWHEELTEITESTYKELRQVIFRMMKQAGLLTKNQEIEPALLSDRVLALLDKRIPSDSRFFPLRTN